MKKLLFALLFIVIAGYAFAEMTFSINTGINLLNETYHDADYKRFMPGFEEQFRFEIFGKNSIIGFFAQDEFGFYFLGDDNYEPFSGVYFSMAAGPSFIIRTPSNRIFASFSIGPILQWYTETYYVDEVLPYLGDWRSPRAYGAFDFGGYGDLAVVLKTRGRFLVRLGVALELFFIRNESGQPMRATDKNGLFDNTSYTGINIKPHIGIGLGYLFD
jgi:hypothetical protein